ncbi:MAG: hypothetical protein WBY93_05710 [Candidatus Binatus sp.]
MKISETLVADPAHIILGRVTLVNDYMLIARIRRVAFVHEFRPAKVAMLVIAWIPAAETSPEESQARIVFFAAA